ncbi:hypothetical protein [Streptomyces sp. CB00455]|uniref:hypothetical protein n=1 Tax=Streptomyces sp. CB00455 TaxID=1703927 RepID=UPI0011612206|nr:hypothetical protein [Streptomyces sp. CB00455]
MKLSSRHASGLDRPRGVFGLIGDGQRDERGVEDGRVHLVGRGVGLGYHPLGGELVGVLGVLVDQGGQRQAAEQAVGSRLSPP